MIHLILILIHSLAGVVALVLGCAVLRPPASSRAPAFRIYHAALLSMVVVVVAVVAYDWPVLDTPQRMTFSSLSALGAYTAFRGIQARHALTHQRAGWRNRYIDHVGFTVISLFDGFAIVAAIDLGAPPTITVAVGLIGVVAGIVTINHVKAALRAAIHEQPPPARPAVPSIETGGDR